MDNNEDIPLEDNLIYQQKFTVRIHEINQSQNLTMPALMRLLQEASMQHIIKLKASVWDLADQNISWVLLRKQVKILSHIKMGETITVLTYPTGFDKFFAYRDYLVFNENKKLVYTASSMWSLINTETRKLSKVPKELLHLVAPEDIKRLKRPEAFSNTREELTVVDNHKIKYYDLDWNGHVNNVVLYKHMIQALLGAGVSDTDFKEINVQYKNECLLNEEIQIVTNSENSFSTIRRGDDTICSLSIN